MGKKAVVFGAQGQLGHELVLALTERGVDVVALGRGDVDVTDRSAVAEALATHTPTWVFNGTAYNAVDLAEQEVDAAFFLNGVIPGQLSAASREVGATFMHFSTDYVFGDGFTSPIDESHSPAPLSSYGRSKHLGERLALQNNARAFVLRCCGLYSERRNNFVRTMLKYGLAGRRLTVVRDQMVSPTWVGPLARFAVDVMEQDVYGTYHAVAGGGCSWFDYAKKIFDVLGVEADLWPIDQKSWGAAARRPAYSVLDNGMARALGIAPLEDWDVALEAFLERHGEALLKEFQP